MTKSYYLTVSARGFCNETAVYRFSTRDARDSARSIVNNNVSAWAEDLTGAALSRAKRQNAADEAALGKGRGCIQDGDSTEFRLNGYGELVILG